MMRSRCSTMGEFVLNKVKGDRRGQSTKVSGTVLNITIHFALRWRDTIDSANLIALAFCTTP